MSPILMYEGKGSYEFHAFVVKSVLSHLGGSYVEDHHSLYSCGLKLFPSKDPCFIIPDR